MMDGKAFDVWLILEFSGAMTDMPIVEWIANVELVCELCAMGKVKRILPLQLRGGTLAMYRRLSKQALITAYTTYMFNAFNQFE